MPRLPAAINWISGGSRPGDFLMTLEIPYFMNPEEAEEDILYSQVMSLAQIKDLLYGVVNSTIDRLELKTINQIRKDEDGNKVYADGYEGDPSMLIWETVERLKPSPQSRINAIVFKGPDLASKDDDEEMFLNWGRMPDADVEAERNESLAIIDRCLTPLFQLSQIICSGDGSSFFQVRFAPLNPIEDLDYFFGLS